MAIVLVRLRRDIIADNYYVVVNIIQNSSVNVCEFCLTNKVSLVEFKIEFLIELIKVQLNMTISKSDHWERMLHV